MSADIGAGPISLFLFSGDGNQGWVLEFWRWDILAILLPHRCRASSFSNFQPLTL